MDFSFFPNPPVVSKVRNDLKWAVVLLAACACGLVGAGLKDSQNLTPDTLDRGSDLTPGQIQLVTLRTLIDPEWVVLGWYTRDEWDEVILVVSSCPEDKNRYEPSWDSVLMIIDRPLTEGYLVSQATQKMDMPNRYSGPAGWKLWRADARVSMDMLNRSETIEKGILSMASPHTSTHLDFPGSVSRNATPVAVVTDR